MKNKTVVETAKLPDRIFCPRSFVDGNRPHKLLFGTFAAKLPRNFATGILRKSCHGILPVAKFARWQDFEKILSRHIRVALRRHDNPGFHSSFRIAIYQLNEIQFFYQYFRILYLWGFLSALCPLTSTL
jgi:hypothetical protein